jgi:hypothetical protein
MSLSGVCEGRRFSNAEKGLDQPSGSDRYSNATYNDQKAEEHGSHLNTSPLPCFLRHDNEGNRQNGLARECLSLYHEAFSQGHCPLV